MGDPFSAIPATGPLLSIALAALAGGLSRGFSGFGAALVFIPLASAAIGPHEAVPALAVMECVACLGFLPGAWRDGARGEAALMSAGGMLGVPLGAMILARSDPVMLRWALCGIVVLAMLVLASGWRWRGVKRPALTLAVGGLGGVMSGTAMLGGVPPATYWLGSTGVAGRTVRANMNLYFAVLTVIVTLALAWQGLLGWRSVWFAASALPAYGVALWAGSRLFWIASDRTFRRVAYGMILASALFGLPLWDGARP